MISERQQWTDSRIAKEYYLRIATYSIFLLLMSLILLDIYGGDTSIVTLLFIILISVTTFSFFYYKDIMHPFNIFFMNSQFLFIYNMIDVHVNKSSFRYGTLSNDYFGLSFALAILVIVIWYIFMYFGFNFGKKLKNKNSVINIFNFKLHNPLKIAFMLIGVSLISFFSVVLMKDGISGMIDALAYRTSAYSGLAYMIKLVSLCTIGALILLQHKYFKTSLIVIGMSFIMISLFGGRSAAFFGAIFPYIICYHYSKKKIKPINLIFIGLIAILFAIALGNYRLYQEFRLDFNGLGDILSTIAHSTQGGEILPSLIGSLFSGEIDYAKGGTLINIIFAPIPRTIWKNKPLIDETGIIGRALMGDDGWGLPPGPYGVSFYNFGIIGVVIVGFLTGILIYKTHKVLVANQYKKANENIGLTFYSVIIPSLFNFISTSSQINIIWYVIIFLVIKNIDKIL